ncbi:MAG TPA: hypothetical protein VEV16_03530 [Daejeonella sp.]|nr:hypothetical protein [Daejeonella sp.]
MDNTLNESPSLKIELDPIGIDHLKEVHRWTKLLSIIGFVFLGIMLGIGIFGLISASMWRATWLFALPLFLIVLIYYFPIYYLWKFSTLSKQSILNKDADALSTALKYLKLHYRSMAILLIILILIYCYSAIAFFSGMLRH